MSADVCFQFAVVGTDQNGAGGFVASGDYHLVQSAFAGCIRDGLDKDLSGCRHGPGTLHCWFHVTAGWLASCRRESSAADCDAVRQARASLLSRIALPVAYPESRGGTAEQSNSRRSSFLSSS